MIRLLIILFTISVTLLGCEVTSDIILDRLPEMVVVETRIDSDSIISVELYHTVFIQDDTPIGENQSVPGPLSGARVDLFKDGQFLETLVSTFDPPNVYHSPSQTIAETGSEYRIEINSEDYPKAEATASPMPDVEIADLFFSENPEPIGETNYFTSSGYRGWIELDDDPEEDNYYVFDIIMPSYETYIQDNGDTVFNEHNFRHPISPMNDNLNLDILNETGRRQFYNELYVSDEYFDSETIRIEFYTALNVADEIKRITDPNDEFPDNEVPLHYNDLVLRLRHISEDHYNYVRSVEYQKAIRDDPFAEPFFIESAVKGGTGIFSIYGQTTIEYRSDRD